MLYKVTKWGWEREYEMRISNIQLIGISVKENRERHGETI